MSMGHQAYLKGQLQGDNSMQGKGGGRRRHVGLQTLRPACHGESYTALSPVLGGSRRLPGVSMPIRHLSPLLAPVGTVHERRIFAAIVRGEPVRLMKPGKRTNGTPKTRYYVQQQRTTGDPRGASPEGVGVLIVAKGAPPARSSEGEQVTTTTRNRGGTRDA
jgi:hypothetical protein